MSSPQPIPTKVPDLGDDRSQRWILIRDMLIFASKAGLEAVRDLALIPAALIAGIAGLLLSPSKPDVYFLRILEVGDEIDDFVDLFGKEKRRGTGSRFDKVVRSDADDGQLRADDIFDRIEKVLVDEYKRGGVTAQAKEAIDRGLDVVHEALGGPPALPPPEKSGDKDVRGESDGE